MSEAQSDVTEITGADAERQLAELFTKARGGEPAAKESATKEPADDAGADDALDDALESAQRVADGDDTPADDVGGDAADDSANAPDEADYEYNGKVYRVPKALVDGDLRQADYTRKTQEVAEVRRVVVAERESARIEAQAVQVLAPAITQMQNLEKLSAEIESNLPDPYSDTAGYLAADKRLKEIAAAHKQLRAAIDAKRTELVAQKQAQERELLDASLAVIKRDIPKWGPELATEIGRFATELGYTDAELPQIFDPRFIKMAHKAMLYDRLEKSKPAALGKVNSAAPVVKPKGVINRSAVQANRRADAVKRAAKSGSTGDAEAAMLAVLQGAARKR